VNHSCEPNCGIRDEGHRIVLFALRDIPKDEEITFDYSTTQTGGFWSMLCRCGSSQCRGMIGDFKDLPTSTRTFYIQEGAVLSYLLAELGVQPSSVSSDSYKSGRRSRKKPIPARNC
jgi:SET domain